MHVRPRRDSNAEPADSKSFVQPWTITLLSTSSQAEPSRRIRVAGLVWKRRRQSCICEGCGQAPPRRPSRCSWGRSLRRKRGAFKRYVGQDACGAQGLEIRRRGPSAPWLSKNGLRRALFSFRGVSVSSAGLQTPSATVSLHRDMVPTPAGRDLPIPHSPPLHSKQRSGAYHHPDLDKPPQPRR